MQKLDLDDLLSKNAKIYVRNATKPKGQFILTFKEPGTNVSHPFMVAKTWIPLYVSGAIPRRVIAESMDFRKSLNNGTLILLDPESAEKELAQAEAQDELKRLNSSAFAQDSFSKQSTELAKAVDAQHEQTKLQAEQLDATDDDTSANITPAVLDLVQRVNAKSLEVGPALNELRIIQDELTVDDCNYVVANCDGKIRSWAKSRIEDLVE